jgi:hypothetical protein
MLNSSPYTTFDNISMFTGVIFLVALAAIMTYFSMGQLGRAGGKEIPIYDYSANISADTNNILLRYLPTQSRSVVVALANYLGQGYYGLALCPHESFVQRRDNLRADRRIDLRVGAAVKASPEGSPKREDVASFSFICEMERREECHRRDLRPPTGISS